MINNRGSFWNQYNNVDEQLFSDYQRPRDHEWFKVRKKKWINESNSEWWWGGWWWWEKVRTMNLKFRSTQSVSCSSDNNREPIWIWEASWDWWFCEIVNWRIKFLEAWIYLFSYRESWMETFSSNEWRHVSMFVHWANYAFQWEMIEYAIINDTSCNIEIWRASPLSTTWYAAIEEWEEIVYCFTCAKRSSWSATQTSVNPLISYLDIIKIW